MAKQYRSARSGQYVTKDNARQHAAETVAETSRKGRVTRCVVDRLESDFAVLEFTGDYFLDCPRSALPADVADGSVLKITIEVVK